MQTLWSFLKSWKPSCWRCLRKWWVHGFECMWKYDNNINWQKFSCMAMHNSKSKVLEKIYFMYIFYFIFCIYSKLDKKTTLNFLKKWLLLWHDDKDVHYAHGLEMCTFLLLGSFETWFYNVGCLLWQKWCICSVFYT
jgi:hypothetical protein